MAEQQPHDFLATGGRDLEKQPSHLTVDITDYDNDNDDDYDQDRSNAPSRSDILDSPTFSKEKPRTSADLNRFYAVKSRLSTRGLPEPPPPPDGGFEAWTQVACVSLFHVLQDPNAF